MPRIRNIQQRFTQGEIDPKMLARSDIDQYYGAAATMTNVFPLPQGGFRRRPGLKYIEELQPQTARETGMTITAPNGGTTANANDNNSSTLLTTTTGISTTDPYVVVHYDLGSAKTIIFIDVEGVSLSTGSEADEFKVQVSTDNSTWTTIGAVPLTTTARSKRYRVNGSYRYVRFARIGTTDLSTATVSLREFWVWSDAGTLSNAKLIDFVFNTDQTYMLVATEGNIAVYKDGVHQADVSIYLHDSAAISTLSWTQSADTLLLFCETVVPYKIQRNGSDSDWVSSPLNNDFDYVPQYAFTISESQPAATLTPSATTGNITLTAGSSVFSASDVGQKVYGNAGRARIVAYTSGTVVDAVVEIPFFDTGAIASGSWTLESGYEDAWSSSRGWPRCGVFHEGRLWLAGSTDLPSTIWGSRAGLFFDFDPGSLLDDDGIEGTLDTGQFNKILNLYSGRTLQILTTGGEHAVLQPLNEPITPANFNAKKQTSIGSREDLRVVEAEGSVLFVQREGESIQEMIYDETQQAYISNIVSLISSHLIVTPVDFALRKATSTSDGNYLLIVNSDGTLTVGAIQRSQLISAFAKQTTNGTFKACGVDNDEMYFVVERSINGSTVRYIEVFDFDYTLDAALRSTSGVPTSSFSGFDHLEGEEVKIVVDSADVIADTVASGAIGVSKVVTNITTFTTTIAAGATTGTTTLGSSVDTSLSAVFIGGYTSEETTSTSPSTGIARVELTNGTTVTATRASSSSTEAIVVYGTIVEFSSRIVKSVQHGTIAITGTSNTDTVTSVDTDNAVVVNLGASLASTSIDEGSRAVLAVTNATTVTATRGTSNGTLTQGYCLIDFQPHVIESVQHITEALGSSSTLIEESTITSVDMKRTMLVHRGQSISSGYDNAQYYARLAGPTIVQLIRKGDGTHTTSVGYTAVQFKKDVIELIQRGVTDLVTDTSKDTSIQTITPARTFLNSLWHSFDGSGVPFETQMIADELRGTTLVRTRRDNYLDGSATVKASSSWEVVMFEDAPSQASTQVEVGLDYTPTVKDLPVEEPRIGTAMGRKKNVSEVNLELYQTKNVTVNTKRQTFAGFLEAENYDATNGFTGIRRIKGLRGWDLTGQVTISQDKPLPMTVLSIVKRVNV